MNGGAVRSESWLASRITKETRMYALTVTSPGGPERLEWTEVPDPVAGPGEVVIDVVATAVNRADLAQREGRYPPPPGSSAILGLECSGRISELGEGVDAWSLGDEVCALLAGGGYATRVAVPAAQVMPVPDGVDVATAGCLPEVACTVWSNVVNRAGLTSGETFLVQGGASGIGSHAIQVAKALGARVAATAGNPERLKACLELGADVAIDYHDDVADHLLLATDGHGADVILDIVGASALANNVAALAMDGRLVIIAMQGGATGEIDLRALLRKRGSISATTLRARPGDGPQGKGAVVSGVRDQIWPLIAARQVAPVVSARFPLQAAAEAHRALAAGGVVGKLLLVVE